MTQDAFAIKLGDAEPPLDLQLTDTNGDAYDLTGVSAFETRIRKAGTDVTLLVLPTAVLGSASAGQVRATWGDNDTIILGVGDFEAEVHATKAGKSVAWPSSGYIPITVWDQVNELES